MVYPWYFGCSHGVPCSRAAQTSGSKGLDRVEFRIGIMPGKAPPTVCHFSLQTGEGRKHLYLSRTAHTRL